MGEMGPGRIEEPVSTRSFWGLFTAGWIAYFGILAGTAAVQGESFLAPFASAIAPVCMATVVASQRRRLLRVEASILKTVALHVGLGATYAASSALLSTILLQLFQGPVDTLWVADPMFLFGVLSFNYLLLYTVLAGFLMWTESINRAHESQAATAREAVLRAQAEAKALRAQFNPHFVFNTLHSLMSLVREDPKAAEKAIEDVAALIRYASVIERRGQDAVPLGQELKIAERYLALETLRLSERLEVGWDVRPGLEHIAVPSFSLQTLLENAIKHGLAPKPEGGAVRIGVTIENGKLALSVEDDGMGADPIEVERAEGTGLSLLERRVEMLFGDEGSLTWKTAPGQGFSVLLRIPASPVEKREGAAGDRWKMKGIPR
jgi:sensor histidine kinase YesM